MIKGSLYGVPPGIKFLISMGIILFLFFLFSLGGTILAVVIYDIDLFTLVDGNALIDNPENTKVLIFLQTVQTLGLYLIPSLVIAWLVHPDVKEFLSLSRVPSGTGILLSALVMVTAIPLINFLAEWNKGFNLPEVFSGFEDWMLRMEEQQEKITRSFLRFEGHGDFWKSFVVVAVLPGIGEELLFRGVIQNLLVKWFRNKHWAILVTSIVFSVVHFQFYGFVPRMLMGMLFGYLLVWSGSLWYPVVAHFMNNGMAVVVYFYIEKGSLAREIETMGASPEMWYITLLSLVCTVFLMLAISRMKGQGALSEQ